MYVLLSYVLCWHLIRHRPKEYRFLRRPPSPRPSYSEERHNTTKYGSIWALCSLGCSVRRWSDAAVHSDVRFRNGLPHGSERMFCRREVQEHRCTSTYYQDWNHISSTQRCQFLRMKTRPSSSSTIDSPDSLNTWPVGSHHQTPM